LRKSKIHFYSFTVEELNPKGVRRKSIYLGDKHIGAGDEIIKLKLSLGITVCRIRFNTIYPQFRKKN